MSNLLDSPNWRYATKKFDASKKISDTDLQTIKEAIRLSASSYGLQPYKVLIIESPEIRAKIQPVAWGQSQIVEASHLLVFANQTHFGDAEIEAFGANIVETRGISAESIQGYVDFMKSKISTLPLETRNNWTSKQAYIALGTLLNTAASLKIDATPMEGFEPEKVNEILGLDKLNLNATLIVALGYRHEDDIAQHFKKVRKSNEEFYINL